jgi:hypothetical protein
MRGRMGGMSDDSPNPKRAKWWMPPEQLKTGAVEEFAPLVVLGTVGWAIAAVFLSLAGRLWQSISGLWKRS